MPGHLVLSLDFELHWGIRDHTPASQARDHLLQTRRAIPRILRVLEAHEVCATWATVGFLMARDRDQLEAASPRLRPGYDDPRLDPYAEFAALGSGEDDDPLHFGRSLVEQIAATPGQEIGTHTMSHYYTLEDGQDLHHFAADLAAASALHRELGLPFDSLVFPRNQFTPAHVEVAAAAGIVAVRGASPGPMYSPARATAERPHRRGARLLDAYLPLTGSTVRHPTPWSGARVVDVASSRFVRPWSPRLAALEPVRLRRIVRAMERAARTGGDLHLWFHPHNFGAHTDENLAFLERVLDTFGALRETRGMRSVAMGDRARQVLAAA